MAAVRDVLASFETIGIRSAGQPLAGPDGEEAPRVFAPLVFRQWKELECVSQRRIVGPRQVLSMQDEPANSVIVIETGIVKLVRVEGDGGEFIAGLRSDGWIVDAAAAFMNGPSPFSTVTMTNCAVRSIPRAAFVRLLDANPSLMRCVVQLFCREIHAEHEQLVEFRSGSAQSRLNRLVRELSGGATADNPLGLLPLKRLEIAQLLSITPEHLSRLLHQCRQLAHGSSAPQVRRAGAAASTVTESPRTNCSETSWEPD